MTGAQLDESTVRDALREVIDPELGCNIVDLGLIYGLQINGSEVAVTMTLTSPACPVQESIALGVQRVLLALDAVQEVNVSLVWDPPWSPARLNENARRQLGITD